MNRQKKGVGDYPAPVLDIDRPTRRSSSICCAPKSRKNRRKAKNRISTEVVTKSLTVERRSPVPDDDAFAEDGEPRNPHVLQKFHLARQGTSPGKPLVLEETPPVQAPPSPPVRDKLEKQEGFKETFTEVEGSNAFSRGSPVLEASGGSAEYEEQVVVAVAGASRPMPIQVPGDANLGHSESRERIDRFQKEATTPTKLKRTKTPLSLHTQSTIRRFTQELQSGEDLDPVLLSDIQTKLNGFLLECIDAIKTGKGTITSPGGTSRPDQEHEEAMEVSLSNILGSDPKKLRSVQCQTPPPGEPPADEDGEKSSELRLLLNYLKKESKKIVEKEQRENERKESPKSPKLTETVDYKTSISPLTVPRHNPLWIDGTAHPSVHLNPPMRVSNLSNLDRIESSQESLEAATGVRARPAGARQGDRRLRDRPKPIMDSMTRDSLRESLFRRDPGYSPPLPRKVYPSSRSPRRIASALETSPSRQRPMRSTSADQKTSPISSPRFTSGYRSPPLSPRYNRSSPPGAIRPQRSPNLRKATPPPSSIRTSEYLVSVGEQGTTVPVDLARQVDEFKSRLSRLEADIVERSSPRFVVDKIDLFNSRARVAHGDMSSPKASTFNPVGTPRSLTRSPSSRSYLNSFKRRQVGGQSPRHSKAATQPIPTFSNEEEIVADELDRLDKRLNRKEETRWSKKWDTEKSGLGDKSVQEIYRELKMREEQIRNGIDRTFREEQIRKGIDKNFREEQIRNGTIREEQLRNGLDFDTSFMTTSSAFPPSTEDSMIEEDRSIQKSPSKWKLFKNTFKAVKRDTSNTDT